MLNRNLCYSETFFRKQLFLYYIIQHIFYSANFLCYLPTFLQKDMLLRHDFIENCAIWQILFYKIPFLFSQVLQKSLLCNNFLPSQLPSLRKLCYSTTLCRRLCYLANQKKTVLFGHFPTESYAIQQIFMEIYAILRILYRKLCYSATFPKKLCHLVIFYRNLCYSSNFLLKNYAIQLPSMKKTYAIQLSCFMKLCYSTTLFRRLCYAAIL